MFTRLLTFHFCSCYINPAHIHDTPTTTRARDRHPKQLSFSKRTKEASKGAMMMELEGDSQDDAFYAELKRQILHLTADDDDDRCGKFSPGTCKYYGNPVGFDWERRGGSGQRNATLQQTGTYYSSWEQEASAAVPAGAPRLWPDGKGTGVFIPYIVGRKQRIGRKTKRTQQRGEKKTQGV